MRIQNRRLTMRHPSQPAFQSIHTLHGFPIIPNSEYPFKKNNYQLCDKSLYLDISEFPHKNSKDNDVPQSLIYGINEKRGQKSQKWERKNEVIDSLKQNKTLICQG